MPETNLNIIISATDKASGIFGHITKGFHGIGSGIMDIAKIATGFIAADLIGGALRTITNVIPDMISSASNLNETMSKTKVVFGEAGDMVLEYAEKFAPAIGQSKQTALDAAATFGIFGKSAGLTGEALGGFSTDLVGLASDIASFSNATPEEVVMALGAALRGESEPMRRFGVLLDDASVRAKALELGIVSTTKDALTPQQRILAVNALLWEQTADAQGDFARTSGGLANQQRLLNAQMENMKATLGTALLPVMAQFMQMINTGMQSPEFQKFLDWAVVKLGELAVWLGENVPIAIEKAGTFWREVLQPALMEVGDYVNNNIIPILKEIWTWIGVNLPPVIAALAEFWTTTLQPALAAVWAFIQDNVIPILVEVAKWLGTNLPPIIKALADFWTKTLWPALQKVWNFLTVDMMPIWKALGELLGVVIGNQIKSLVWNWENILKPALEAIWKFISEKILPIFEGWGESIGGIKGAIETVVGWISNLTEALKKVTIPSWLEPGSPSPFEVSLRGIADAMADVNAIATGASFTPRKLQPAMAGGTTNNTWNVYTNAGAGGYTRDYNIRKALSR